jgi:hypothetical protein
VKHLKGVSMGGLLPYPKTLYYPGKACKEQTLYLITKINKFRTKSFYEIGPCGLYYKHITIINYDSGIVNKLAASLTDDARVVIYDCHMFIVQAPGLVGRCRRRKFSRRQSFRRKNLTIHHQPPLLYSQDSQRSR